MLGILRELSSPAALPRAAHLRGKILVRIGTPKVLSQMMIRCTLRQGFRSIKVCSLTNHVPVHVLGKRAQPQGSYVRVLQAVFAYTGAVLTSELSALHAKASGGDLGVRQFCLYLARVK